MRSTVLSSLLGFAATFVAGQGGPLADASDAAPSPVEQAAPAGTRTHEVERAPDGLFYIRGSSNGATVDFAIDSGASVVVLTAADARRLGIDAGTRAVRASTAAGATTMRRVRIAQLTVGDRTFENVEAAVAGSGMAVSLLGQSALSRFEAVTFSRDRVRFD